MATVLLNGLASTAGGGITYLRNVLPRLARIGSGHRFLAIVPAGHADDYRRAAGSGIEIETAPAGGLLGRLWWEQTSLRGYLRKRKVDVLVSLGNFALFGSPARQILFNRNDLYFSGEFERDLLERGLYGELAGHRLKRALARLSIKAADANVTPTAAFAERIRQSNGLSSRRFTVIPFGFDAGIFNAESAPLTEEQMARLRLNEAAAAPVPVERPIKRLLYVSHYNYFRNFETLIRALPLISEGLREASGEELQLVLTTEIRRGAVYGGYDATRAAELIEELGVSDRIAMLGAVPYSSLHHLYRLCDLFVCPSYSESFGHPLLEAMAAGLPVAASDLAVHREVCGEAAVYFDLFDERALAGQVLRLLREKQLAERLKAAGVERARRFSWDDHVRALLRLVDELSAK